MRTPTIICAVDFSEASIAGLRLAVCYTLRVQGHLRVVHVVRPSTAVGGPRGAHEPTPLGVIPGRGTDPRGGEAGWFSSSVEMGDVADEIVRIADCTDADLIVIGSRPKSGWERIRDGYLPGEVAAAARCPVVVLEVGEKVPPEPEPLTRFHVHLN